MKVIGVIPARYKSSRFPGKPLTDILEKPMIIWVCEKAAEALGKENVYVATDDQRISQIVEDYGYHFVMTSSAHMTGTDRLAEVAAKTNADVYVNIQGDEPMINPRDITKIVAAKVKYPNYVINGMSTIGDDEDPKSINIPKLVVNSHNELLYMSRLPIPGIKDSESSATPVYKKQVCIYAFNKSELKAYGDCKEKMPLESFEDIEIIRFLELGYKVKMIEVSSGSLAVDVFSDVEKVENAIRKLRSV